MGTCSSRYHKHAVLLLHLRQHVSLEMSKSLLTQRVQKYIKVYRKTYYLLKEACLSSEKKIDYKINDAGQISYPYGRR